MQNLLISPQNTKMAKKCAFTILATSGKMQIEILWQNSEGNSMLYKFRPYQFYTESARFSAKYKNGQKSRHLDIFDSRKYNSLQLLAINIHWRFPDIIESNLNFFIYSSWNLPICYEVQLYTIDYTMVFWVRSILRRRCWVIIWTRYLILCQTSRYDILPQQGSISLHTFCKNPSRRCKSSLIRLTPF